VGNSEPPVEVGLAKKIVSENRFSLAVEIIKPLVKTFPENIKYVLKIAKNIFIMGRGLMALPTRLC
jgi:hypothetical protein